MSSADGSSATWRRPLFFAIGGLCGVGFSQDSAYLLVVSHQGRGVFDCRSGERVARDPDGSWSWYNDEDCTCEGIGPLEGTRIPISGTSAAIETNRRLASTTADGCSVEQRALGHGEIEVRVRCGQEEVICIEADSPIAVGFSEDGRAFLVAESPTLTLLLR